MPHFIAKLPAKTAANTPALDSGKVESSELDSSGFTLHNIRSPHISLIAMPCTYQNRVRLCFLQEIVRSRDVLLKCLKPLRPTPIGIAKDALSRLKSHYEVLQDNLSTTSPKQQVSSPFLLSEREIVDLVIRESSLLDSSPKSTKPQESAPKSTSKPSSPESKSPESTPKSPLESSSPESSSRFGQIILEIGFGSGRHILHVACANPNALVLGLEIHTPSIEQVLRQIEILGLSNLYLARLDARIFLQALPDRALRQIYIHFPVPWNSAKHRRVLSATLLKQALRALDSGGELEFRTDDREYFSDVLALAHALESASKSQKSVKESTPESSALDSASRTICVRHSINEAKAITSKYEARWLRQSKDIYTIVVQRGGSGVESNTESNTESSLDSSLDSGAGSSDRAEQARARKYAFSFDEKLVKSLLAKVFAAGALERARMGEWLCAQRFVLGLDPALESKDSRLDSRPESALESKRSRPDSYPEFCPESSTTKAPKEPNDFEPEFGGFLRISDVYASSAAGKLALLVSFGEFAYPCSRLVLFTESGQACYLPEPPIPTPLNHKAHALLARILPQVLERS